MLYRTIPSSTEWEAGVMKLGSQISWELPPCDTVYILWLTPQARTLQQLFRLVWIIAIWISTIVITYLHLISLITVQSWSDGLFWPVTHTKVSINCGWLYCGMHLHNQCRHGLQCLTFNCIVELNKILTLPKLMNWLQHPPTCKWEAAVAVLHWGPWSMVMCACFCQNFIVSWIWSKFCGVMQNIIGCFSYCFTILLTYKFVRLSHIFTTATWTLAPQSLNMCDTLTIWRFFQKRWQYKGSYVYVFIVSCPHI